MAEFIRASPSPAKHPGTQSAAPAVTPAISFRNVSTRYPGGYEALTSISFDIAPGELVFMSGHSGAGKSTLLKLVPAIERASAGAVLINGQNVSAMKRTAIPYLRRNLGLIFQDQKLLHDRNALENVLLPLQLSGSSPAEAARRARAALDKVGLLAREKANPVTLSGGEQQRLCIARAIVNRPGILLADEPTANLDADYAADIMAMFKSFHDVGVTVLIATHDSKLSARHQAGGARVLQLDHGRLGLEAGA